MNKHIDWDGYRARLTRQGDTYRERLIERTKDKIRADALRNPGCREVLVDDIPQRLYINHTQAPNKKTFNSLPDETITLGSVVLWEDSHWLVTECVRDDNMTYFGAIERCNRELIWQNPQTREIIRRWCTLQKPYFSNLEKGIVINLSTREFKVQLPYDEESSKIDIGKRFMLDFINGEPKVYSCSSVDANTERYDLNGTSIGFLVLNIEQDEYNPETDNKEFGVCDYLPPFDFYHESEGGNCILEADAEGIVPGGLPLQITSTFFDQSGLPLDTATIWTITAPPEAEDCIEVDERENAVTLRLGSYSKLIGKNIFVEAQSADGKISNSIVVKVVNAV